MKKLLISLVISGLTLVSLTAIASEPRNLATIKHELKQYHDSGTYDRDIASVLNSANAYLQTLVANHQLANKKPAIVLDIDETSLSNYPDMVKLDFGGTIAEIRQYEDKGSDKAIAPTLKLYQFAKANHIAVFFITGRFENERQETEDNLKQVGYNNWDGLILRHGQYLKAPAAVYKTAMRKQLTDQGYDIVLSMGDQESDLRGGYADKTYKLPNPYYLIP